MSTATALDAYTAKLPTFEGKSPWPYLDARKINGVPAPLVTVGIGCALEILEARTLPFAINGAPAGVDDISREWAKVQAMPPGMVYTKYEYPGCLILPDEAIDALVRKRLVMFVNQLIFLFPQFESFPDAAKIGCLDLIYGMGLGRPAAGSQKATGLYSYPTWRAAVLAQDWKTAAANCGEDVMDRAYELRNQWRESQFLAAVTA